MYTIRFPEPASKSFTVEVQVPAGNAASVDLMMPVWSPGFYGIQNYAQRVSDFSATASDGTALEVTKPSPSRWTIAAGGRPAFKVTYTVAAPRLSNLGNGVTETAAAIIGPATYVTLAEAETVPGRPFRVVADRRPAEVRLELPAGWTGSMTSLDAAPGGRPNHYVAPDYDVLADSPILAGVDLTTTEFKVGGITHYWTYLGKAEWDGAKVVAWITPLIEEHVRFWGGLPFRKYAFLNIVGGGGSGVEHLNSVAITTSGREPATPEARFRQAAFLSHEYFHAMNVKRLRPIELGPFDYEHPPVTTGLWVGEGLTSYFGDLLAARSGVGTPADYLNRQSRHITDLQTRQPGRLVQTLEQASAQMFERIPAEKRVDYYVKGPVVGLVLDAHIRRRTNGQKSLDDGIRLAYQRWSGARGYTGEQFNRTISDAAGVDVGPLLHRLVATTEEVDYAEMLEWFGLRFSGGDDPAKAWTLEVRPDATAAQRAHFAAFLAPTQKPPAPNPINLGSDANGNPLRRALKTGHVSNYDEAKVAHYSLPDPLVTAGGKPVRTAADWKARRAEILKLYETEIYGRVPPNAPKVTWQVTETNPAARGGIALMKRVVGRIGAAPDGPRMNVTLHTPAAAKRPSPVILLLGFRADADPPVAAEILSRGWGYATVAYQDIQPDRANAYTEGVIGLTLKPGQTQPAPDEWGTIAAWAWGVSRIVDYLETDRSVDASQIALHGFSRLGKTALWAAARDERIAAVFSACAGEMGSSLSRRDWGETVDDMAQNFSWQFAGHFQKYVGRWSEMPVDAHMLIALSAPRPVFLTGGTTDQWADPKGAFLAAVAAGPVYRLLRRKDLGVTELPPLDTPITSGDLGWHYHTGGHVVSAADWSAFLSFLQKYFRRAA